MERPPQRKTLLQRACYFITEVYHGDFRNPLLDLRYGGLLRGYVKTRYIDLGATDTANSDINALETIFRDRITPTDVLVDVGCGKGRVFNFWLSKGYRNPMIGLELDEEIAARTRRRLRRYKNITILAGDAMEHLPTNGALFYLFHPFEEAPMRRFSERMQQIYGARGGVTVFYHFCIHLHVFREDPRWIVEEYHPDQGGRMHDYAVIKIQNPP